MARWTFGLKKNYVTRGLRNFQNLKLCYAHWVHQIQTRIAAIKWTRTLLKNVNVDIAETRCRGMHLIELVRDRIWWSAFVSEPSYSIKSGNLLAS